MIETGSQDCALRVACSPNVARVGSRVLILRHAPDFHSAATDYVLAAKAARVAFVGGSAWVLSGSVRLLPGRELGPHLGEPSSRPNRSGGRLIPARRPNVGSAPRSRSPPARLHPQARNNIVQPGAEPLVIAGIALPYRFYSPAERLEGRGRGSISRDVPGQLGLPIVSPGFWF